MTYEYATDAEMGTIDANSLEDAYDTLRAKITDEMIDDGATLWVQPKGEPGERLTMGDDRE